MKNRLLPLTLGVLFFVLGLFYAPKLSLAYNEYQKCDKDTACTVGEFLYDDSYVPIASATCRFTSRYPNGDIFINGDTTSSTTDGWYSYQVQATGSAGLYRSQLCCQTGTEYLCLDKSFKIEATASALTKTDVASAVWDESRASHTQSGSFGEALQNIVPSGSDIASAVWGYSGRTLSAFGTLPSDIWSYSSRTLSSFGDLIANIWGNNSRTLTSSSSSTTTNNYTTNNNTTNSIDTSTLAKKTDVDSLKTEVLYNQSLLEKLANKPIITNSLEQVSDANLQSKLNQSQVLLTKLFADSYSLDSKLGMIDIKWNSLDGKTLASALKEITALTSSIGDNSKQIKDLWNLDIAEGINTQAVALKSRLDIVQSELAVDDKSKMALTDLGNLSDSLNTFINTLGTAKDSTSKNTFYGKINEIKQLADTFDLYSSDADKLLSDWNKYQPDVIQKKTNDMAEKLAKINKLPQSIALVSSFPEDNLSKKLKNRVLSIKATIQANKILLARKSTKPFSSSWLEEGSVIFKTLLTNPSTRISQEVPLKYYLPAEIKKEDIISVDDGLKVNYDVDKKQLYVEGIFTLGPDESKVVAVRVTDIWTITSDSIASLRRQADDLMKPLEKTSYFGQGVTIKSNIDVTLDKILVDLKAAITPEAKIKTYYESQIEIKAVKDQIAKLEDLVTQAGSFGSMAGFVGGAQAVAVWGLIIIMVAGFVFLVIYMRVLRGREDSAGETVSKKEKKTKSGLTRSEMFRFASIFFIFGSVTSLVTSFTVYKMVGRPVNQSVQVEAKAQENIVSPIPEEKVLGIQEREKTVTIADLSGDFLKVRESPKGAVVAKVYAGEKYPFVKEQDGWIQIKLQDGAGWVSKEFVLMDK